MGICASLQRAPDAALRMLLASPSLAEGFFEGNDESSVDLDKAWHGIHFLLAGSADASDSPLGFLAGGGDPIGEVGDFEERPRVFFAEAVEALATALDPLSEAVLRGRFDAARMTALDVYPPIWDREDEAAENLAYLLESFAAMKSFLDDARRRREGIIVQFS